MRTRLVPVSAVRARFARIIALCTGGAIFEIQTQRQREERQTKRQRDRQSERELLR